MSDAHSCAPTFWDQALVDNFGGTLKQKIKEATRLEAKAVDAQKTRWVACYRMIRAAVQGDSELEALFARC